ncbi:MAG: PrsW family intramembrane metalloprotease [Chloroflexi bacterium]|nr:PrsW family intramembrane metalloprotease [Chloroflexota bacterium]
MQQSNLQPPIPKGHDVSNHQRPIHWPSVWQLGLSLIAALTLWGFAAALFMLVVSSFYSASISGVETADPLPLLLMAAGAASGGILLIPSAGYALLRILGRPNPIKFQVRRPGLLLLLLLPPVVALGHWVAGYSNLAWIALPPLHVIAAGLPILGLLLLGLRGLSPGSPQRAWGIFGSGLVLGPALSLVVEAAALAIVAILGFIYLSRDTILVEKIMALSEQLPTSPESADAILELLEPYLLQPGTIYLGLVFGAIFVPLIEELFKPIGVWLLVGRNPTAVQGFAAGLISGAGYALFENFALAAGSSEEWSAIVLARMGTSLIHIFTAGLTGWALALAWREGRYIRLGVTYLVAVSIHALWNGLVIMSIVPEFVSAGVSFPNIVLNIGSAAPVGFMVLIGGSFALLLMSNAALRRAITPPARLQPGAADVIFTDEENLTNGNHFIPD